MKKACVIGWPIEHSRSPLIHGYWLNAYGIEGSYTREAVQSDDLPAFLKDLAGNGFAGCNVTVPHKEAAYKLAGVRHASANAVGAANTLWHDNGQLIAANTDTYGYMTYLKARYPDFSALSPIILQACQPDRAVRYASVTEMHAALLKVEAALARSQPPG